MKFVLVGPVHPYRGGIAHYTAMLARALSARGSLLGVISFRRQYPRWLYPGKSDRDPSLEPLQVPAEYLLDPLYPWTWLAAARRVAALGAAAVIFQWWSTFWAPAYAFLAWALRRRGIRVVFIIHNTLPHETRFHDRFLARLALRRADRLIVMTGREKERLRALLPHAAPELAHHPLYDMFAGGRLPRAEAKARLGLPASAPLALFFGLVRPYKGLRYAIQALGMLTAQNVPLRLLAAGEFWEDAAGYARLAAELGVAERVRFDDRYIPNEEVALYFSAADLFLAPYIDATQSGAVKIALSFNLPLVASRALLSEELEADRSRRIYWVTPGDAADLAAAILRCLHEQDAPQPAPPPSTGWGELLDLLEGASAQ